MIRRSVTEPSYYVDTTGDTPTHACSNESMRCDAMGSNGIEERNDGGMVENGEEG